MRKTNESLRGGPGLTWIIGVLAASTAMAGGPPNDQCNNPQPINGDGIFNFQNTGADSDGPNDPGCDFFGSTAIDSDVWFCWTADTDGDVLLETCGLTPVDTKIAIYAGCSCPPQPSNLMACNDDQCDLQSAVNFPALAGEQFLVRLGTFPGAPQGGGVFSITTGGNCIPAGVDCFATTVECGENKIEFGWSNPPIPGDFFDPGSEPFFGEIRLQGADPGNQDVRVQRLGDLCLDEGQPATVPIQIEHLDLVSCDPITVVVDGQAQPWDVSMTLSDDPQPQGGLEVVKTHPGGGVFAGILPVQPRFVFVRASDLQVRILDFDPETAVVFDLAPSPWLIEAPGIGSCAPGFVPGVEFFGEGPCCFEVPMDSPYTTTRLRLTPPNCPQFCQDCNRNGIPDSQDISGGSSLDCNGNSQPDECDPLLLGDGDLDGDTDADDQSILNACLLGPAVEDTDVCGAACLDAFDMDYDNDVDLQDVAEFQIVFNTTGAPVTERDADVLNAVPDPDDLAALLELLIVNFDPTLVVSTSDPALFTDLRTSADNAAADPEPFETYLGLVPGILPSAPLTFEFDVNHPAYLDLFAFDTNGVQPAPDGIYTAVNLTFLTEDDTCNIFTADEVSPATIEQPAANGLKGGCCAVLTTAHSITRKMGRLVPLANATTNGGRDWDPDFLKKVRAAAGDTDNDRGMTNNQIEDGHEADWNDSWRIEQVDEDVSMYDRSSGGGHVPCATLRERCNRLRRRLRTNDDITMWIEGRFPNGRPLVHSVPIESATWTDGPPCACEITITRTSRQERNKKTDFRGIPVNPGTATYKIFSTAGDLSAVSNTEFGTARIDKLHFDSFDEEPKHAGVTSKTAGGPGTACD